MGSARVLQPLARLHLASLILMGKLVDTLLRRGVMMLLVIPRTHLFGHLGPPYGTFFSFTYLLPFLLSLSLSLFFRLRNAADVFLPVLLPLFLFKWRTVRSWQIFFYYIGCPSFHDVTEKGRKVIVYIYIYIYIYLYVRK